MQPLTNKFDCNFPVTDHELERLQSLHNLNILDSSPDERFDRVVRLARRHFNVPVCRVSLVDRDRVWFKSSFGTKSSQAPRHIAICSHSVLSDDPIVSTNLLEDPRFHDSPQVVSGPLFRFYAGIPLRLEDGSRVGSFCIIDNVARPNFNDDDVYYLRDLAQIVADHLETQLDPLTGLLCREEISKITENRFLIQKKNAESHFAVLYFDIDRFKRINDTFGHAAGDEVLRAVGKRLKSFSSEKFSCGRLSGDEFLAVVKSFDNERALDALVGDICTRLSEPLQVNGEEISMSASIGVCISSNHSISAQQLIDCADSSMYTSKSRGGACYTLFAEEMKNDVTAK